jgi:RimK family alpha-L-glutamate ligase
MIGAIIVNGYYQNDSYKHQVNRLMEEFQKRNVDMEIYANNKPVYIGQKFKWDFGIFLDKDINFARILEDANVVLFNSSFAIECADSKVKTAQFLSKYEDIVLPITIPAPLKYQNIVDENYLCEVAKVLKYPIIVKSNEGSLGREVFMAKDIDELKIIEEKFQTRPHLYQQYVEESCGKSIRVIVINHKVICAMLLKNDNDFRSNANLGGKGEIVSLDEEYIKAAQNIATYMDLDYCGIDFFYGASIVIEVNSNAYFKEIEELTNINIASNYSDYIIKTLGEIII